VWTIWWCISLGSLSKQHLEKCSPKTSNRPKIRPIADCHLPPPRCLKGVPLQGPLWQWIPSYGLCRPRNLQHAEPNGYSFKLFPQHALISSFYSWGVICNTKQNSSCRSLGQDKQMWLLKICQLPTLQGAHAELKSQRKNGLANNLKSWTWGESLLPTMTWAEMATAHFKHTDATQDRSKQYKTITNWKKNNSMAAIWARTCSNLG